MNYVIKTTSYVLLFFTLNSSTYSENQLPNFLENRIMQPVKQLNPDYKSIFKKGELIFFTYSNQHEIVSVQLDNERYLIYWNSNPLFDFLKKHLSLSPIIIEIGSFWGENTIKMAKVWPQGTIYSFEPIIKNFIALLENIEFSKSLNVKTFPSLPGSIEGEKEFALSYHQYMEEELVNYSTFLKVKSIQTPYIVKGNEVISQISWNNFLNQTKITHIDLLWLNINGASAHLFEAIPLNISIRVAILRYNFLPLNEDECDYHYLIDLAKQRNLHLSGIIYSISEEKINNHEIIMPSGYLIFTQNK